MHASWKRLLPLGVILIIGIVHVWAAPHERPGSTTTTACSPKELDLRGPVAAWLTP